MPRLREVEDNKAPCPKRDDGGPHAFQSATNTPPWWCIYCDRYARGQGIAEEAARRAERKDELARLRDEVAALRARAEEAEREVAIRREQVDSLTEANGTLLARAEEAERERDEAREDEESAKGAARDHFAAYEMANKECAASEAREREMREALERVVSNVGGCEYERVDNEGERRDCRARFTTMDAWCPVCVARAALSGSSPAPSGEERGNHQPPPCATVSAKECHARPECVGCPDEDVAAAYERGDLIDAPSGDANRDVAPIQWLGDATQDGDIWELMRRRDRFFILGGPTTLYFKSDNGTHIVIQPGWWIYDWHTDHPRVSSAAPDSSGDANRKEEP